MRGFATILYDEFKGSSFRGIKLTIGQKETLFDTGDPVVDFWDYIHFISEQDVLYVSCSSSFDHYFMDGAEYDGRRVMEFYFDPQTLAVVSDFSKMSFSDMDRYLRLWVYEGMETIEDLREYIRKKKEK